MDNLYTDEQWHMMVNACISRPRSLAGSNLYDLTFTGPNAESHFYSHWHLVEDVLVEVAGLDIIRLTINGRYRDERRYSWGSPSIWEVTITHSGGCYVKNFYT